MTEEKKAIEDLKEEIEYYKGKYFNSKDDEEYNDKTLYSIRTSVKDSEVLINLIEKQAKEIKYVRKKNTELVEQRSTLQWEYEELQDVFNHYKSISIRKDNVVEKDKVMKVIDYFEHGMQKEFNGYIEAKYPFEVSYSEKVAKILRKELLEEG